jgi:hypothetical protein
MTALEAMAPTVRWGYLDLNQAERAPGYEPPMVIQELMEEMPYHLSFLTSSIKNAISFKACFEFRYFKLLFVKD